MEVILEPGKSKLLLKRYYCNNHEICGYSEEIEAPYSALKSCVRCELVKYCSKDCELQKWPEHQEMCKERRNLLRRLGELRIELSSEFSYKTTNPGLEYNTLVKRMEKQTYALAQEKLDYFLFEKAYEFFRLSINYYDPATSCEIMETHAKELDYQLTLSYDKKPPEHEYTCAYPGPQSYVDFSQISSKLRKLIYAVKSMHIPEVCDYMNSYETFVCVLRFSPKESVLYQVYCNDIPLRHIKRHLEIEADKDCDAFVKANAEQLDQPNNILEDLISVISLHPTTLLNVLEDIIFNLVTPQDAVQGYATMAKAFVAFLEKHPQIQKYLCRLFLDWKTQQQEEESEEEEEVEEGEEENEEEEVQEEDEW